MPQYLNQILVHCVFHKHAKAVNIQAQDQLPLNQFVMQTCHFLHCPCLIANGVADHLHFLLVLATNTSVADVIKEVKRKATLFLKERNPSYYHSFCWQGGYGAFSVSIRHKDSVYQYIYQQQEHHKKISAKEEFEALLRNAGITKYDEKFYWST
jgi:hypothetical protein